MYNSAKILGRFAEEVGNALSAPPTQTPGLPSWARELESMSMAVPAGGIAFKGGMSSAKLLGKLGGKARKLFSSFLESRAVRKELGEQGAFGAEALAGRANRLEIPENLMRRLSALDMSDLGDMQLGDLTAGGIMKQFGRAPRNAVPNPNVDRGEFFRMLQEMSGGRNMGEMSNRLINRDMAGKAGRNVGPLYSSEAMNLLYPAPRY